MQRRGDVTREKERKTGNMDAHVCVRHTTGVAPSFLECSSPRTRKRTRCPLSFLNIFRIDVDSTTMCYVSSYARQRREQRPVLPQFDTIRAIARNVPGLHATKLVSGLTVGNSRERLRRTVLRDWTRAV